MLKFPAFVLQHLIKDANKDFEDIYIENRSSTTLRNLRRMHTEIREVDFKPNSTIQNRLVRWDLHELIYYWNILSLVDVKFSTHLPHAKIIQLVRGTIYIFKSNPIASR